MRGYEAGCKNESREKSLGSNGRGLKEKMEIKKWDEADQKEAGC